MKARIVIKRIKEDGDKIRYCIEAKKHWWSRWKNRDWADKQKTQPIYYPTYLDALINLPLS